MTSLVHPEGTVCRWCRTDAATTTIYGWATCVTCALSRENRIKRWLRQPWVAVPVVKA